MRILLLLIALSSVSATETTEPFKIFSGEPRLIVVQGYSTSNYWPHLLRRKLDRHFEERHEIEVRSALRGGTPIAKWMDVQTDVRLKPWIERIRPALQSKGERPAIVLSQQSLQWVFGERTEGIRSSEDTERIRHGADVIGTYVDHLLDDGADKVFIAMHIYKHPMEPEIGHERLALARYLARNVPQVHAGPDVWLPTRDHYPRAFDPDGLHPGSIGIEIMAQLWFETLLEHDGIPVPEWSRQQMRDAIEGQPTSTRVLRYRGILPRGNLLTNDRWKRVLEQWDLDGNGKLDGTEETNWAESDRQRILSHARSTP